MIPYLSGLYLNKNYQIKFFNNQTNENPHIAKHSYELRHKVYCSELGFEPLSHDMIENDEFDKYSVGCVIFSKKTKQPIASMRLISLIGVDAHLKLPFTETISNIHEVEQIKNNLNNLKHGEISRLLILNDYRHDRKSKFQLNYLLLILYASVIILSKNLDCVVFVCEKKMISLFKKIGVPFSQLSTNGIEHHGTRYPIKIDITEVNSALYTDTTTIKIIHLFTKILHKKATQQLKNF
jgi:N-acyl-L-homoserine lactone synthetase